MLQLHEDVVPAHTSLALSGPGPRAIYVVRGACRVDGERLRADDGALGAGAGLIETAERGATCWRFELVAAPPAGPPAAAGRSRRLLSADLSALDLAGGDGWFLRLDSVAFPPGGCALLHTHQGPGIRCLLEGAIRIDSEGRSTHYRPGEAWFEAGPEPVFAAADAAVASRFIRAMVLPARLAGRSSIAYVREEDRAAPKSQRYRVYGEQPL